MMLRSHVIQTSYDGADDYLTNHGANAGAGELGWQGLVTAKATASGLNASAADTSWSYLLLANNKYAFYIAGQAISYGTDTATASGSGTDTVWVQPGATYEFQALA